MIDLRPVVWVIDDEEMNRVLARAYLEILGWRVIEFTNGDDVVRALPKTHPDAMLVDVRMPGLPGDELVRTVRQRFTSAELRVVGYTAFCADEKINMIKSAGFDLVLIKPVSFQQMSNALPASI